MTMRTVDSDELVRRLKDAKDSFCGDAHRDILFGECIVVITRMKAERDAALAVVRAVYQESKAIHAAYKLLPDALRAEVEGKRPEPTGGALHCAEHGGYGFSSDCIECKDFEARR